MSATHAIYIDDSGTKEYAYGSANYVLSGGGISKYFVFCGILVSRPVAGLLTRAIMDLKLKYFKTDKVEIKSHWLRRPEQRQARYLDVYKITDDDILGFVTELYGLMQGFDLELIASVIDKPQMQEAYRDPWYAPATAYDTLLMRAVGSLGETDRLAVLIDDTTGATPNGNAFRKNLSTHHAQLRKSGSRLKKSVDFSGLDTQSFVDSSHSHIVQLADICAFSVHKQFQMYGAEWEDGSTENLPLYAHFAKIENKFRHNERGQIQGFGIVKMPAGKQLKWTLDKK